MWRTPVEYSNMTSKQEVAQSANKSCSSSFIKIVLGVARLKGTVCAPVYEFEFVYSAVDNNDVNNCLTVTLLLETYMSL